MPQLRYITILFFAYAFNAQAEPLTFVAQQINANKLSSLSSETRTLLKKEMRALNAGLKEMISAYIQGDWKKIGVISQKMHNSYLFKQQLTTEQKKELKQKLPLAFIKRDQAFHRQAFLLEKVSKSLNQKIIYREMSTLTQACLACHQIYATTRFPNLIKSTQ